MIKRIVIGLILIGWPWSVVRNLPKFETRTIFEVRAEEKRLFEEKLGLDTSRIKRFYYNKTTVWQEKYWRNLMVMLDLNNYFFGGHPREDVAEVDYRPKFFWWTIVFLGLGVWKSIKEKKNGKIWLMMLFAILAVAFFERMDGWDLMIYPFLSYLMIKGAG